MTFQHPRSLHMESTTQNSVLVLESDTTTRAVVCGITQKLGSFKILPDPPLSEDPLPYIRASAPDLCVAETTYHGTDMLTLFGRLPVGRGPSVIIIAQDRSLAYAAFELRAVDYLLRPVDHARLSDALQRAAVLIRARKASPVQAVTPAPSRGVTILDKIVVRSSGRLSFLHPQDIDWVEAQGDYVCIHSQGRKHLVRQRISRLEFLLPLQLFVRIHRSLIVNIQRIREMQPMVYGEYVVVLQDGTRLTMSRSYRGRVLRYLVNAA